MRAVLVTGGTGFIGSNLCARLLADGARVRILRKPNANLAALSGLAVEHRIGDVLDAGSVREAMRGCDTVFHAAAIVSFRKRDRQRMIDVNAAGTRTVVEGCLKEEITRLVHVSSIAAIGYTADGSPATEETPYNWGTVSAYRYSKHLAEQEVASGVTAGLPAVMVNPSVVVGERDIHFHGGEILRSVRRGIVLLYPAGGMNVVYVGDVVNGAIAAALLGRTGERYILGGANLSYREVFARAAAIVGRIPPLAPLPSPLLLLSARVIERTATFFSLHPPITEEMVAGATRNNRVWSAKAERELGYRATPVDEALRAAYGWYRRNGWL